MSNNAPPSAPQDAYIGCRLDLLDWFEEVEDRRVPAFYSCTHCGSVGIPWAQMVRYPDAAVRMHGWDVQPTPYGMALVCN